MTQPNHSARGHAEFSPSSLKYVAACAGYEGRDGTSAAAEMGTRIHEALEIFDPSALHDEEEIAIYEQIVEMEKDFMSNFGPVKEELNEIQVDVKLNGTETWGTCDRFLILECDTRAVMADYKTGISIIDPPDKNWQAKAYTVGAFQRYPQIEEITFVFYVPQHDSSPHHTFKRNDLPELIDELSKVILAGESIRPKWENASITLDDCTPSQYCRFCKHEDHCPSLGGLVIDVAKKLDSSIPDVDPNNLDDPARVSELYNIAKIVENWSSTIKARALEMAKDGVELDGLRLKSMGRTRKIEDNNTFVSIAEEHGIDIHTLTEQASFPLSKIAKLVGSQHEKGDRREKQQIFLDACEEAGIIRLSDERFTLTTQ